MSLLFIYFVDNLPFTTQISIIQNLELRKWLNRPNNDVLTNLQFGIKARNSIKLNLITKHEIITKEFCRNLRKFRKHHKYNQYFDGWLMIINEFLSLTCSPGAISSTVKSALIDELKCEAKKFKNPSTSIFIERNIAAVTQYYNANILQK